MLSFYLVHYTFNAGYQCRLLLENINKLHIPESLVEFKSALKDLKALHVTCNSQVLPHNYCEIIDNFSRSWFNLSVKFNLSTTPKVHILTEHLCDYFDDSSLTLIKVTDEIVESCHQLFNKTISKGYKIKSLSSTTHGVLLHNAVLRYNTYNLRIKM